MRELLDAFRRTDGFESSCHDLTCARLMPFIQQAMLEQLCVREDDTELIVQLVKKDAEFRVGPALSGVEGPALSGVERHLRAPAQFIDPRVAGLGLGSTPQRVGKDSHGATGGSNVLDFAARHPVVDGSPADADKFARPRNGNCLTLDAVHVRLKLSARLRNSYRPCLCVKMPSPDESR